MTTSDSTAPARTAPPWLVICSLRGRTRLTLRREGEVVDVEIGDDASSRSMEITQDQVAWLRHALIAADLDDSDAAR